MADGWTYDTLSQAIQDWVEDDNNEFVGQLPEILRLGETKLARDLSLVTLDHEDDGAIEAGQRRITKPEGTTAVTSLHIEADGQRLYLEPRHYDWVAEYGNGQAGTPRYYAEVSTSEVEIAPVPDVAMTYRIRVVRRPMGLQKDKGPTWLATHLPDALLYACLIFAEEYLKADESAAYWRGRYNNEVLPAAKAEHRELIRRSGLHWEST